MNEGHLKFLAVDPTHFFPDYLLNAPLYAPCKGQHAVDACPQRAYITSAQEQPMGYEGCLRWIITERTDKKP